LIRDIVAGGRVLWTPAKRLIVTVAAVPGVSVLVREPALTAAVAAGGGALASSSGWPDGRTLVGDIRSGVYQRAA